MNVKKVVEERKSGGGTEIQVNTDIVEIPEIAKEEEVKEEGELPEVEAGTEGKLVAEALIETIVKVTGKTLALVTKIPEMDFDDSETQQLVNLWSPFVPKLTPLMMAVLGTVVIAGGKIGTYMTKRPKKSKEAKTAEETKKKAESIEKTLEEEWKGG